ncbi:hypothetical protein Gotur_006549 [Gossypium turneri]
MPKNPNYDGSSYNNPVPGPRLQIHPELIGTNADVAEGSDNDENSDHDVDDFSDPDLDEVPNNIDDEGLEEVDERQNHQI